MFASLEPLGVNYVRHLTCWQLNWDRVIVGIIALPWEPVKFCDGEMCDVSEPTKFLTIEYPACPDCGGCYYRHFLLLPKVGPLRDDLAHRGVYLIQVADLALIDDWEVEEKLRQQEITPVELEEFDDFDLSHLRICEATEIRHGVLSEDQLSRSRIIFQNIDEQLKVLNI